MNTELVPLKLQFVIANIRNNTSESEDHWELQLILVNLILQEGFQINQYIQSIKTSSKKGDVSEICKVVWVALIEKQTNYSGRTCNIGDHCETLPTLTHPMKIIPLKTTPCLGKQ